MRPGSTTVLRMQTRPSTAHRQASAPSRRPLPAALARLLTALCALALAGATLAAGAPAAATAARARPGTRRRAAAGGLLGGVNIGAIGYASPLAEADRAIAAAAALHARVVRVDVPWSAFEPQRPRTARPACRWRSPTGSPPTPRPPASG